ncbi:YhcG family protein [Larkinella insperata]|uniref:YhcG family protein n=1 Tax=Larkinella insperata TaxID=332158 RepID=A0ABW3QB11_9BACT
MVPSDSTYQQLLSDIKQRVRQAQYKALQSVNREQVQLYFELGRLIVERQQQHGWGKSVVESLAKDLQTEFAGMTGFSVQNLWYMRQFFLEYSQSELLQPLVGEISWSKHLLIMARCKGEDERLFYIIQTKRNDWTKNVLIHQIEGGAYQRILASQQNFTQTLPKEQQKPAVLAVKDEYTFDFLELANEHSEYELEQALLANIRRFLIEMGGDFTFVGNQYRLELGGQEFFIDLLLFHRQLQCLIAVELKIDEFKPEFAGKMNFYLSVLNDRIKKPHENPSIGIIICKAKQRTIVEFALKDINKPIGVATYTLTPTLPDELSKFFPTNEQLIERVEAVTDALRKK